MSRKHITLSEIYPKWYPVVALIQVRADTSICPYRKYDFKPHE